MYNYLEEIKKDVTNYIEENIDFEDFDDLEELEEKLNEDLWIEDSVTGNGSGSYTFSRYQAEQNIAGNLDLAQDVIDEFGIEKPFEKGAEYLDVSIRCYLLGQAIAEVLEECEEEFEEAHLEAC